MDYPANAEPTETPADPSTTEGELNFLDRKVVKKLEFTITKMDEAIPFVLYEGRDYSRMNDLIHTHVKREGIILMPLAIGKDYPFIVVCKDFETGWNLLCETLQKNIQAIADRIRHKRKRRINVDALTRTLNKVRDVWEQEEGITLKPLEIVLAKDKK